MQESPKYSGHRLLRLLAPSAIQGAITGDPIEKASEKGDHYGHKADDVGLFSYQGRLIYLVAPGSPGYIQGCILEA